MNKFLRKLEKSLMLQCTFFVVSMTSIFAIYVFCINRINYKEIKNAEIIKDRKVVFSLDINEKDNVLTGWVFREESKINKVQILLQDVNTGQKKIYGAKQYENMEVERKYFLEDEEYGELGFEVRGNVNSKKCYEIFIVLTYDYHSEPTSNESNIVCFATDRFLYGNEVHVSNPLTFLEPEFMDGHMKNVISNGILKLYSKEHDVWVYQYEDKFYYVTGDKFEFATEGKTHISYHVFTTKVNELPEERIQYGFDNLDFRFEDNELIFEKPENYRVAVKEIPKGYPITNIYIANYDDSIQQAIWWDYFSFNK